MTVFWRALFVSMIALSRLASSGPLSSCSLASGNTCVPPDDAGDVPGSMLAVQFDPFTFTTVAGTTAGVLKTEVFREAGGTLDFYYILFNTPTSATSLTRESVLDFTGWNTSVAFRSDGSQVPGFVDGDIAPLSADRDPSGARIGFTFGPIPPNERSKVVVVSTNAPSFAVGYAVVDGSGPLATFEPSVPEPGSLLLVSSSIVLILIRRTMTRFQARSRNGTQEAVQ
jgi:hypothetical protein